MGYKIAFDPSIRHIGYCVFVDGKPVIAGTFNRPSNIYTYSDKLKWVYNSVNDWLFSLSGELKSLPRLIVIEDFQAHTKHPTKSLLKLAASQGAIFAASYRFTNNIKFLNKGKAPKTEAELLANNFGITGSEHALDALHLGVLARFDK